MRSVHRFILLAAVSGAAFGAGAAEGLKITPDTQAWPSWQTRLSVVTQRLSGPGTLGNQLQLGAASLSGDHYFDWARLDSGGGLRATSSLLIGPRTLALGSAAAYGPGSLLLRSSSSSSNLLDSGADSLVATPYIGLGYSAWWARSGLGLSADLGFIGQQRTSPGMRLGDSADSQLRTMQMAPVLQVNLSYSF